MNSSRLAFLGMSLSSFLAALSAKAQSPAPYDATDRSQVFIDKVLVAAESGVKFTLHPAETRKQPAGYTGPWSHHDSAQAPLTTQILRGEGGVFETWTANGSHKTSVTGLEWTSPPIPGDPSWARNYLVWFSVFRDALASADARYKVVAFSAGRDLPTGLKDTDLITNADGTQSRLWDLKGYYTYTSADGRALKPLRDKALAYQSNGKPQGDIIRAWFDQRMKRYVAFAKLRGGARKFGVMTSTDFITWGEPRVVFEGDALDQQLLPAKLRAVENVLASDVRPGEAQTQFYHVGGPIQLESCTLALPLAFFSTGYVADKPDDGASEFQLAISRDLQHWSRPFREPAIPRGKVDTISPKGSDAAYRGSEWDSCFFIDTSEAIPMGDELWLYYRAYNVSHGHRACFGRGKPSERDIFKGGIGLARWPRDRFVSVDADETPGTLTTVPLIFTGDHLELNASTTTGGEISVELLDADGKAIARSKSITGDNLRQVAAWETPLQLAAWAGKPVALRFRLREAQLYAFAFRK